MLALSIAMIVKNEEKNLPRCLTSVQGLFEELVVVDTGSTDRTVEIARQFGAKVVPFKWQDNFAAARNAGIAHCTGDWILAIDADEAIDPVDHTAVRSLLTEGGPQAFRIRVRNYLLNASQTILNTVPVRNTSAYALGREFTHYVDYVTNARIFRRFPDVCFSGRIHEVVDPYFEARGLPVGMTTAVLHHFGKVDAPRETYKREFYLRLCEEEARNAPQNYRALFNLMIQSRTAERWEACLAAAENFMRLQKTVPVMVFVTAGICHLQLGNPNTALEWLERALAIEPEDVGALTEKGSALMEMGKFEDACVCLERAAELRPGYTLPYLKLFEIKTSLDLKDAARATLLKAIRANPTEEVLYNKLLQLSPDINHLPTAGADAALALASLPSGGNGLWHRFVAMSQLQAHKHEEARSTVEIGLQAFPDDAGLSRLKRLCDTAVTPPPVISLPGQARF
ncbi:MAG: hypothetical protein DVB28_001389 [Verrucomicrobia bacterium]|nr:MAG: hypothetical protein DVB28_001389 [Verrucomicrobiota bacterium]